MLNKDIRTDFRTRVKVLGHLAQQSYKENGGNPGDGWEIFKTHKDVVNSYPGGTIINKKLKSKKQDENKIKYHIHMAAYYNQEQNVLVFSFRGTRLTSAKDIFNNVQLFFKQQPLRVTVAKKFVAECVQIFSDSDVEKEKQNQKKCCGLTSKLRFFVNKVRGNEINKKLTVYLTGHSLGAAIAENIALSTEYETITFDSPGTHKQDSSYLPECKDVYHILSHPNVVNTLNKHIGIRLYAPVDEKFTHRKSKLGILANVTDFVVGLFVDYFNQRKTYEKIKAVFQHKKLQKTVNYSAHIAFTVLTHNLEKIISYIQSDKALQEQKIWPKLEDLLLKDAGRYNLYELTPDTNHTSLSNSTR